MDLVPLSTFPEKICHGTIPNKQNYKMVTDNGTQKMRPTTSLKASETSVVVRIGQ